MLITSSTTVCVIPIIQSANGTVLTTDIDKVNAFNDYFTSVFTQPIRSSYKFNINKICISEEVDFSQKAVFEALRRAQRTTSSGPDSIPLVFWVNLAYVLTFPISIIFNLSYKTANLPSYWRNALVLPLHEKGDASIVYIYRPISLICTLCKIVETMIKNDLQNFAFTNNIFNNNQHGFIPNCSICTQLLECHYNLSIALENNIVTDVILINFNKAFDIVPHNKLVHKLESFGVRMPTLKWILVFLLNRFQAVQLNGVCSKQTAVASGVIQESLLGPTLFTFYVNDLPAACPDCFIEQFADDTKTNKQIVHIQSNLKHGLHCIQLDTKANLRAN